MERERERENFVCTIVKEVFFAGSFAKVLRKGRSWLKFFKGVFDGISSLRVERVSLDGIRFRNCPEDFSFVVGIVSRFYDFSSTVSRDC